MRRMFLVREAAAARMMAGAESRYSLRWCSPRPNWSRPTLSASLDLFEEMGDALLRGDDVAGDGVWN